MQKYSIYGDSYELMPTTSVPVNGYAVKGALQDTVPKGKIVGYVEMSDGSIIECYKQFNPMIIILPIILIAICCGGVSVYYFKMQPKDVVISKNDDVSVPVKTGTDKDVVQYNGFAMLHDGQLNLDFKNGSVPCTITISGDGLETASITVQPGEYVQNIPMTFSATSGVVNAVLTIVTETSTSENNIVVEIPENNTGDSGAGLAGSWQGEYIYGVQ